MRSLSRPPATTHELLALLRRARLLDDAQAARLGAGWAPGPAAPHVEELVQAGLLTRYQAEQVRAGRPGRLRLGPYRLLDRLGDGRPVFRAEHTLLRRLVVLKVLGRRGPSRREVRTAGMLDHPHIVAAQHADVRRGRLVLVLEHVDGIDLHRFVAQTGPLPAALACEVTRQAALALAYLHGRGLVHRDVKPANLVLGGDGPSRPVVKLLDLGLACPAGRGDDLCGTMDYMAPERGTGDGCTAAADIYGLGCTLYHLLAGRPPFPGGSWTAKMLRHRLDDPEPIGTLRPDVSEDVGRLVAWLMAREPEYRPASADEVVATLEAMSRPAPAPRPRRSGLAFGLGVAVVLGLLSGGAARWLGQPRGHASEAPVVAAAPAPAWRLDEAVAAASDGGTVEVPAGTHVVEPVRIRAKRLTLRAAAGERPVLLRRGGGWDALIDTDADVELVGLELRGDAEAAPLVSVEGAAVVLRDCRLEQGGPAPLVSARRVRSVSLMRCQLKARRQAVAVEAGPEVADVRVEGGSLAVSDPGGVALLLWAGERTAPGAARVALEQAQVRAGRVLACRAVAGPVDVCARNSQLAFAEALVSLDGYGDREAWRRVLRWSGQGNRFAVGAAWLRLEGEPK